MSRPQRSALSSMQIFAAISLLAPLLSLAQPNPAMVTGNINVHDPSMCKDNNGTYWLFSTAPGIEIRTSKDRTAFTLIGRVWAPNQAAWTVAFTGTPDGELWGPDCQYINGQFFLHYAASAFGSSNAAIFLATSLTGKPGSWVHQGFITSTSAANNYTAIDPNLIIDTAGKQHLTLGSFRTGIKQLTQSVGSGSAVLSIAQRNVSGDAIEAAYIFRSGNFYYLFTSWDDCCKGLSSTYNIRVTRSTAVSGPFVDKMGVSALSGGGTLVLGTHDSIVGPGGQSVFLDNDGPILVYHYYTATSSLLGINRLDFSSGWPVVV